MDIALKNEKMSDDLFYQLQNYYQPNVETYF